MHGLVNEAESALAMCALLALVFAGIRTLIDPHAFVLVLSRVSGGLRRFSQLHTRLPWSPEQSVGHEQSLDRGTRRFARLFGLLMTMLGLLGIFEQLSRLA